MLGFASVNRGVATTVNFDTAGTTGLYNIYSGQPRGGEKVTDATYQSKPITEVKLHLSKTGSPTGTGYCRIRKTSDGSIVATAATTIDVSTITGSRAEYTFTFSNETTPAEAFYVLFEFTGGAGPDYITVYGSTGGSTTAIGVGVFYDVSFNDQVNDDARGSLTYLA